jgi:hypothetical protein
MNLHGIASGYVSSVNPWITGSYQKSTGSAADANFERQPTYAAAVPLMIQMQAMTSGDLRQVSGLNLNGELRAMYCNGAIEGVDRPQSLGGDLITLPDASIWLVAKVLENWNTTSGWTKFCVVRQN